MYSILYIRLGENEMEKLGRILLFILNILLDIFLVLVAVVLVLWLFWDIPPENSVKISATWVEQKWNHLTGRIPPEGVVQLSQKQRRRAHRHLYVQEADNIEKNKKGHISQPYKYEYNKNGHKKNKGSY